jgi:hypothetical protein
MTWVYSHTQSLLLAILMHASFTGWLLAAFPKTSFMQSLAWQSVLALTHWGAAVMVLRSTLVRIDATAVQPDDHSMEPQKGSPP